MRHVTICVFAAALFLGSAVFGQLSPEEAMKRLKERQQQKAAPSSRPVTQPSDTGSATAAIRQLVDDLDTAISRGRADKAIIDACFGNIRGKSYSFSGSVFGTSLTVPFAGTQRAILVTLSVPPAKQVDDAARRRYAIIREKYDLEEKDLQEKHRLDIPSRSQHGKEVSETAYRDSVASLIRQRDSELKTAKAGFPTARTVNLYLSAPDAIFDSVKRGQAIRGEITFLNGTAESTGWKSAEDTTQAGGSVEIARGRRGNVMARTEIAPVTTDFSDKIQLLATFRPS